MSPLDFTDRTGLAKSLTAEEREESGVPAQLVKRDSAFLFTVQSPERLMYLCAERYADVAVRRCRVRLMRLWPRLSADVQRKVTLGVDKRDSVCLCHPCACNVGSRRRPLLPLRIGDNAGWAVANAARRLREDDGRCAW